ncbi:hypothetical protein ACFPOI_51220 [Nonomuraea angiospora]|uniref:Uncharacterized protein n=1 Tax=Nonomuraea angiospora TaxID=46172 RepID=A0ABR9M1D3_9ACTN|nr:hypothetical protein [Nonomuraea angiospora]MBE1586731.1 hypothetical protein [Nonomuraea angiospora]
MAETDLAEIGKTPVIRRIMKTAEEALLFPPRAGSPDEGWVSGHEGSLAWRRAIPLSEEADDCDEATDHYFVYRASTDQEYREAKKPIAVTVVRVLPISELMSVRA